MLGEGIMPYTICRREDVAARSFPPLTSDPYLSPPDDPGLSADQRAARQVLAGTARPRTRAQRLGRHLATRDAVARLLWLHRSAVRAELKGRLERADFWWQELERQWEGLPVGHPSWDEFAGRLGKDAGAEVLADPRQLRTRLARELLLDTHLAFHNGLMAGAPVTVPDRAAFHFAQAVALADAAGLSTADQEDLQVQDEWKHIAFCEARGEWDAAVARAEELARRLPHWPGHQDRLGGLFRQTIERARAAGDWETATRRAEALVLVSPDNPAHRALLAQLYLDALATRMRQSEWTEAVRLADCLAAHLPEEGGYARLRVRIRLKAIDALARTGLHWDTAITLARQLHEQFPERPRFRRLLVDLYRQAIESCKGFNDWAGAVEKTHTLADLCPERPSLRVRADALYREGFARLKAVGDWERATELIIVMARRCPHQLGPLDALFELHIEAATADDRTGLAFSREEKSRREAEKVQQHIEALEKVCQDIPHAWPAFQALALLHHLRAVKLANGDLPGQALLAVAKALAYRPGWEEALQSEQQIEKLLSDYQQQLAPLMLRLDGSFASAALSGALNPGLFLLLREIKEGMQSHDRFRDSGEPEQIQAGVRRARARHFWLRVGLPVPAKRWDERAAAFDEATDLLWTRKPESAHDVLVKWFEVLAERPDLDVGEIDTSKLLEFFTRRNAEGQQEAAPQEEEASWEDEPTEQAMIEEDDLPAEEPPSPAEATADPVQEDESGRQVPFLPAATRLKQTEAVPFEFWLFSRRNLGTKVFAAVAGLLLAVAGALALYDTRQRAERDAAYVELVSAAEHLDEEAARAAAGRFQDARPLALKDARLGEVERVRHEAEDWPNLRARNAAYVRLQEAARLADDQSDDLAVLRAAEAFLSAPPHGAVDPRTPEVLQYYDRAFADWLARQDATLSADAQAIVNTYRTLVAAAQR
jgi:hypothetical protein